MRESVINILSDGSFAEPSKMVIGNKTPLYSHKSVERDIVMLINNLLEDFNAKN